MSGDAVVMVAAFAMASSLVFLISILLSFRQNRISTRLESFGATTGSRGGQDAALLATQRMGNFLTPKEEERQNRIRDRLMRAGLYKKHAVATFLGLRFLTMTMPALLGLCLGLMGFVSITLAVLIGAAAGIFGTIAPGFWIDHVKSKRQTNIRRALPDALDVIVVCLEGGLSLPGAFTRVCKELRSAHPLLASEMAIVQREIQMGRSTGDALRQMAERFDVEELRSMSSVIQQAEKFGASVIKALTVYADALRIKRHQNAEELAHKAGTKMLFPTLLCIFPNIFVVLLAPAIIQIIELFRNLGQ